MNTVIIYATKHGSAKTCAETLSKKLMGKVDVYNLKEGSFPELSQYDNVVIGGSIYAGTIQKEINEFCTKNISELMKKRVGLYICCMNISEGQKQLNTVFKQDLLNCAISKECFGGEFKFKEMNFMERLITKMVSKSLAKKDPTMAIDTKKDLSMLLEQNIHKMAELMNRAV